ncbi:hypothetical protein CROQUDRAFT_661987 [Cronartium quercuum f. sp. fusiforme G11]|uniref:Uncharacterized protein n=1 Tax=Cronartium quercuum f. sp. fusiforme G11 TaxID=708437 RepID=A0A9P6T9R4_9BASI|nr:hypothetical protein CROQUDRAFT_661987 [Cronartium quercuum f. sp. fusiforme G11]
MTIKMVAEPSRIELDREIIKNTSLAILQPHPALSQSAIESQKTPKLVDTCLSLLPQHIFDLILNQRSPTKAFDQLFRLVFHRTRSRPRLGHHLITPLLRNCSKLFMTSSHTNFPSSAHIPFLLYSVVLAAYEDVRILSTGFLCDPFRGLVLEDRVELDLLQTNCLPSGDLRGCLTIVNLSWYSGFDDSDLIMLRERVGASVAALRLDFTSVTDHGIAHLARGIEESIPNTIDLSSAPYHVEDNEPDRKFSRLKLLSLKGLKGVTDRTMIKLAKFPSLVLIDLNQTSCTQTSRTILNRSIARLVSKSQEHVPQPPIRQFRHPHTDLDHQLFSGKLTLAQKLGWTIHPSTGSSTSALVQIDWIYRSDLPPSTTPSYQKACLHQNLGFYHKSATSASPEPRIDRLLCLILDRLSLPTNTAPQPSQALPRPLPSTDSHVRLKRKAGVSDRVLANDLDELMPNVKRQTVTK